jgi:hypothetical protein
MKELLLTFIIPLITFPVFLQNNDDSEQPPAKIDAYRVLQDGSESAELNGEAPAEIRFYGSGNDLVDFYTWKIYKLPDQDNYIERYTDQNITYTFTESGSYIVELETSNTISQEVVGVASVGPFTIETSDLKIPNILLLDGEHQFRVTYKSIISFKCVIFNRWGNKIYEFADPSGGWDGKYKGRYVSPGVYFYVITAQGADGTMYKKGGDINALKPK